MNGTGGQKMANEMRLIEYHPVAYKIEKLQMDAFRKLDKASCKAYQLAGDILSEAPTVDAVEVVRCKNCKHFVQSEPYDPCECMKWKTKWGVVYTEPDGYCHKGERREGE